MNAALLYRPRGRWTFWIAFACAAAIHVGAVGLANSRGNDYFNRRIVFPLADARGRVRGFQARKLHDDDPCSWRRIGRNHWFARARKRGPHLSRKAPRRRSVRSRRWCCTRRARYIRMKRAANEQ